LAGVAPPTASLTPKQQRFVDEYLIDLNATQAAIRAGYSEKTARSVGSENLSKPDIAAAIAERQEKRAEKSELSEAWVLDRLKENVDRSMVAIPVMAFDHEKKQMVETGEWTYQGQVANKALELIGKHRGMFAERHEHRHGGAVEVRVRIQREGRKVTAS
jgi:phage terminase small subunit